MKRLFLAAVAATTISCMGEAAKAATFLPGDGTGTTLLQGISDLPIGDDARSFVAWVNISSVPTGGEALAGYGSINPSSGYHRSAFDIDSDGTLDMQFQVGYVVSTGVSIPYGVWTQVAATYSSSGGVSIYVDGQAVSTVDGVNGFDPSAVDTININNNSVTFGYEYSVTGGSTDINTTGLEFQGDIAADSIWERALTPAEILADYNDGGTFPDTTGLLAEVFGSVSGSSNSVPEPASAGLLIVGLIGLGTVTMRRTRRKGATT